MPGRSSEGALPTLPGDDASALDVSALDVPLVDLPEFDPAVRGRVAAAPDVASRHSADENLPQELGADPGHGCGPHES